MTKKTNRLPWFTLVLIAANLGAAFLTFFDPLLLDRLAFQPRTPSLITAFASIFLHVNLLHLLGNLVFLAAVGPIVEFAKGPARFALVYLVSGIAAVGGYFLIALATRSDTPVVGASGAISGCVAFCAVRFLRTRVPIFVNLAVPVGALAGLWVLLQAVGAVVQLGDTQAADQGFWPHLAGFLAGLLLAALLGAPRDAKQAFGHEVLDRMNDRGPSAALAAAELHLKSHPKDLKALHQKAEAQVDLDEIPAAAQTLKALYSLLPEPEKPALLHRLAELKQLSVFSPTDRLKLADRLAPADLPLAEALYRSVLAEPDETRKPEALLALAELLAPHRPDEARTLAQTLVQTYELHPAAEAARQKGLLP